MKSILLNLASTLVIPLAKLAAKGAIMLVKMTKEPQDDAFLKALADEISKDLSV